ncbi:MAG: transcription antitermination factor NusB [Firmicutes bacterium]|nr:transcription antitermination factor NusB [Bacillota bacterium]
MSRRLARERALLVLFQVEMGNPDPESAFNWLGETFGPLTKNGDFARRLVFGVLERRQAIDRVIAGLSKDWNIRRMAGVDRNIMRMALYEIFYCPDVPGSVAVNEAVELAKIYGSDDSKRFINGILGRVLEKPEDYRPEEGPAGR